MIRALASTHAPPAQAATTCLAVTATRVEAVVPRAPAVTPPVALLAKAVTPGTPAATALTLELLLPPRLKVEALLVSSLEPSF